MRIFFSFFLLLFSLFVQAQSTIQGKVVRILDGDTFEILLSDNSLYKVRMADIDAPEKKQDFGQVAKQTLSSYVFGREVKVIYEKLDRNKRIIGDVYAGADWINLKMVEAGMAWHFKKYSHDRRIAAAEDLARKNRRGLWVQPDALAPWEFRKKKAKGPVVK